MMNVLSLQVLEAEEMGAEASARGLSSLLSVSCCNGNVAQA